MKFGNVFMMILLACPLTLAQSQTTADAVALAHSGQSKLARVAVLAAQGQFGPATELIQAAIADMDRAVLLAPDNLEVRLTRGLAYGSFPAFYGKAGSSREDLQNATRNPEFQNLPEARRARARSILEQLEAPGAHRDRFPKISKEASPLLVVLSVTSALSFRDRAQARVEEIAKAVDGFPGLVGKHLVASVDKPGMFLIFTWWTSKEAATEFYYSDLHQGWMNARGQAITNIPNIPPEEIPLQVGVEIFSGLPGGVQINGGLTPADLFQSLQKIGRDAR